MRETERERKREGREPERVNAKQRRTRDREQVAQNQRVNGLKIGVCTYDSAFTFALL